MRHLTSRATQDKLVRRQGTINLRAYPKPAGPAVPIEVMTHELFAASLNARTENRRRFGRSISMDILEGAVRSARRGAMRDLTDLLRETIEFDPHLGSILQKRFRGVANLPWEVQPATGFGIDRAKAMFYAEVVRQQYKNMRNFRDSLTQLAWGLFDGRACSELEWVEVAPGLGVSSDVFGTTALAVAEMNWIHPRRISFGPQRELRIQNEALIVGGNFAAVGISVLDPQFADKFIWWKPKLFNDYPEREGLGMRTMYWSFFKRFAARERMILTELFGKPWRILTVDEESNAGADELMQAEEIVDAMGSSYTARIPRGINLEVVQPGKSAGQVHAEVIESSDKQNSKLVLGQTGTTDAVPAGLNSNQANVMQDEQLGVLIADANGLSDVLEQLGNRMIAINFGELEVTHAPTVKLRADLPADRVAELKRLNDALQAGIEVSRDEAYEVSGFSIPDDTQVVIRLDQPPTPPNSPVAPAIRPMIIYPTGSSPDVGEQQPPARAAGEDQATESKGTSAGAANAGSTVTVNEDRASRGQDPLTMADGSEDPRGSMTIDEFNATFEAAAAEDAEVEPAGSTTPVVTEDAPEPAKQAMNGAQISAVLDIVTRYNLKEFARESALAMLVTIFPFSDAEASAMLGPGPDTVGAPVPAAAPVAATPAEPTAEPTEAIVVEDEDEPIAEDEDEDEDEDPEDASPPATAFGLSRRATTQLSDVSQEIGAGEMLYGEAGIHAHKVLRQLELTEVDGAHAHVFKLPNGMFIATELDGGHQHKLPNVDADTTMEDGLHAHALVMGGQVLTTGQDASAHLHTLQVMATAVDGPHRHTLELPGPDGKSVTITSMSGAEFAQAMREGDLPANIESQVPDRSSAKKKKRAYGTRDITSGMHLASKLHHDEMQEWNDWVAKTSCIGHIHEVELALQQDQPDTPNGTPEDFVVKGMRELTRATSKWADAFEKAVVNQSSPIGIFAALQQANSTAATDAFGRALERRKIQALMLGTLDSVSEINAAETTATDSLVVDMEVEQETSENLQALITATQVRLAGDPTDFSTMPFSKAVKFFKDLNVLDRATFERATAAIKQRSFTVAGVMRDQMLRSLQAELVKAIQAGEDLRRFSKRIRPKLTESGFLGQIGKLKNGQQALNASHIETVFRTNVLNTYNTGRYIHQTSPAVIAAFPVWEFRALPPTSKDDRTTHFATNGKMLMANDPFWLAAYPPYGFNCRCRVVPRGRKFLSQVVPGSSILDLPDPGFTSGRPALSLG